MQDRRLPAVCSVIAAGSDWPVSSMDPLRAMLVGVTRWRPESGGGPAWLPEEAADLVVLRLENGASAGEV